MAGGRFLLSPFGAKKIYSWIYFFSIAEIIFSDPLNERILSCRYGKYYIYNCVNVINTNTICYCFIFAK